MKAVLQISYVGYKTQEISVNGKTLLEVVLKEDTELLDEVVVVGYGAQKKESGVGAISQVSSKAQLPAANVSQAIAGKIPGVITTQTSGAPGQDDTKINIRGSIPLPATVLHLFWWTVWSVPFRRLLPMTLKLFQS